MKKMFQAAVVAAAVLAVPALSMAQAKPAAPAAPPRPRRPRRRPPRRSQTAHGRREVDGRVQPRPHREGQDRKDVTFALDNSTQKEGDVAVGSTVTVKYKHRGHARCRDRREGGGGEACQAREGAEGREEVVLRATTLAAQPQRSDKSVAS